MLYFNRLTFLPLLSCEQRGLLLTAIIDYARDGLAPEFTDLALRIAWESLRPALDQDAIRYEEICARNRENAKKRWDEEAGHRSPPYGDVGGCS